MSKNHSNYSRLGGLEPFEDKIPIAGRRTLLASLYSLLCTLAVLRIAPNVVEMIDEYSDFLDSASRKDNFIASVRKAQKLP